MSNGWPLPFAPDRHAAFLSSLTFNGVDWTGATFALQVRLLPDTPGTPLVNLGTVGSSTAEGVQIVSSGAGPPAQTILGIRINRTTMEALPAASEVGSDLVLWWDLHVTPSGGIEQRVIGGTFTVAAGVTQ